MKPAADAAVAAAVPPGADRLFAPAGDDAFFSTRGWYETAVAHALPPDARPWFATAADGCCILPLLESPGRDPVGLTTPYTCLYAPLAAPECPPSALPAFGRELAVTLRRHAMLRLDCLRAGDEAAQGIATGMRQRGWVPRHYGHFGNWFEPVGGQDWAAYLASRDGGLRETVRRKLRRAGREALSFEIVREHAGVEAGIAAYEQVYAKSWKEPEPFPAFNPALMRRTAAEGTLRLGLLRRGAAILAAQFWVRAGERALLLKLAHDEGEKAASPGTVLTALMIRHLLDQEHVAELDFGRGDDPYKRLWVGQRRQRVGLVLANTRHPRGLAFLARHAAGALRRRLRPR